MTPGGDPLTLADADQRRRITAEFDATLFVEAAAGTGKTTALVERLANMIGEGVVAVDGFAAITFTDKAAAELRDRLRRALATRAAGGAAGGGEDGGAGGERAAEALRRLDDAVVSTLHAFAQRILSEFALEVGLPPRFDVLDPIEADAGFDAAWDHFVADLLDDADADVRLAFAMGLRIHDLRGLAETFREHWDRLEDLDVPRLDPPPVDVSRVVEPLARAFDTLATACTDPDDRMARHLADLASWAERVGAATATNEQLVALADAPPLAKKVGAQGNWGGKDVIEGVRRDLADAQAAGDEIVGGTRAALGTRLAARVARFTLDEAERRRSEGRLEFHDLLVLARRLLRRRADVRALLQARWPRLFVDEFQDTDPLQIEIAALLAAEAEADPDTPWWELPIRPGSLFLVGDPKQSIYRFRRADIGVWERVAAHFGAVHVTLTSSFRCSDPVVKAVNTVFDGLLGTGDPGLQAPYTRLEGVRQAAAPSVRVLGGPSGHPVGTVREAEAQDLADTVAAAKAEGWWVHDRGGDDAGRPARYGDVALLLPTRRSLPLIEQALTRRGIPYRIESRSLLWGTQEVRNLLSLLRALDDPGDQPALVAALRSPAFACRDADLLEFAAAGGRWSHVDPGPHGLAEAHPVVRALATLHEWHARRHWRPLPALVEEVVRAGRLVEVQAPVGRPRDHRRRLRFVADQARAFAASGGATVREFVDWADRQADEQALVNESVVPEPDDDAVRIMTVHAAKGLEFPVVFLAGLGSQAPHRRPPALFDGDGLHLSLGLKASAFATPGYEAALARELRAEAYERDRLLYVATTRARDHLVLSLHCKETMAKTHAARLLDTVGDPGTLTSIAATPEVEVAPDEVAPDEVEPAVEAPDRRAFLADHEARVAAQARPRRVAATAIAAGRDDEAEPPEVPAWRRGRAGTSLGRAVHAVLQTVDLAGGEGLAEAARAQAAAEGIGDRAAEVERICRAALASETVRAAVASTRFWREVYVAGAFEGVTVEGFVDLLYEDGDDLVVVDYKTDAVRGDPAAAVAGRYRLQGAAYATVIEAVLGRRVSRCTFVFVGDGQATEVDVADLAAAVADVRARVAELAS